MSSEQEAKPRVEVPASAIEADLPNFRRKDGAL